MTEAELKFYLTLHFPMENERCEWKEYKNITHAVSGHAGEDIISYVSAIANMNGGHLVIGIRDLTLDIIGIQNFHNYNTQNIKFKLHQDCINLSSEGLRIEEITTTETNKTMWIIHIPRHPFRQVVYAHKRAWQRIGDSLTELKDHRRNAIIHEVKALDDWSAVALPDATIDELDEKAILKAKEVFVIRNPKYKNKIHTWDTWDTSKFLNKAKLTIKGKITRTCMILLGKEEEEYYLDSSVKIRWNLRTVDNLDKDYAIFSIPFILSVEKVLHKIRNLTYRYLQEGSLFPEEVLRYDPFSIREPLHNAIAHQDYSEKARINDEYFMNMICDYIDKFGSATRAAIDTLIISKLSDVLDDKQKKAKVGNLLTKLRTQGLIKTSGYGTWIKDK